MNAPVNPLAGPVLGIESSCDETGVALCAADGELLAHAVPLVRQVLDQAGVDAGQLGGVGYTAGPGLAGALLTGAMFGRSYAAGLGIPAIDVHHMEGHLLSFRTPAERPCPSWR